MPISWNEIRHNAIQFARQWAGVSSEIAEKQTFWNEFFAVFGISRRTVANFEERVGNLSGSFDRIDLFWPGTLVVEHKSLGKDLGVAESQAHGYIASLATAHRHDEVPRYVIASDFARISLLDLEPDDPDKKSAVGGCRIEFPLAELHRHIHEFAFIPGYQQHRFQDQDPLNLRAVSIMGDLHDALEAGGYTGHELERFLVRILFCLFGRRPESSTARHSCCTSTSTRSRTARTWGFILPTSSTCSTLLPRDASRTLTNRWPRSRT